MTTPGQTRPAGPTSSPALTPRPSATMTGFSAARAAGPEWPRSAGQDQALACPRWPRPTPSAVPRCLLGPAPGSCRPIESAAPGFLPSRPGTATRASSIHPGLTDLGLSADEASGYDAAVRTVRRDAVREVLDDGGVPGLLALGRAVTMPIAVGWAAGEARGDDLAGQLLPLLGAQDSDGWVAHGWAGARIQADGVAWIERHLEGAGACSAAQQAGLLVADPMPSLSLIAIVDHQHEDVRALFWQRMSPSPTAEEARPTVARELIRHSRPWAAMSMLVPMVAIHGEGPSVDLSLVEQALERAATGPCEDARHIASLTWQVRHLLDHLERAGRTSARAHAWSSTSSLPCTSRGPPAPSATRSRRTRRCSPRSCSTPTAPRETPRILG